MLTMLCEIGIAALFYGLFGVQHADGPLRLWGADVAVGQAIFNLLYFSTVVFTTVGLGDIVPIGTSKIAMMVQGLSVRF